jgi:hypothetical protein
VPRCEHYSTTADGTRDHLMNYDVGNGLFDIEYLEALFLNDMDAIMDIEAKASLVGFDPCAYCSTITNVSSVKVHCRTF